MLPQRRGLSHRPAVLVQQISEMKRSRLRREAGHSQYRAPDDRRLDHRRGVDADDRRGMEQRVEEVATTILAGGVERAARPDDRSEERRAGKEWRTRWAPEHSKQ